jgi:hypothetical protein
MESLAGPPDGPSFEELLDDVDELVALAWELRFDLGEARVVGLVDDARRLEDRLRDHRELLEAAEAAESQESRA